MGEIARLSELSQAKRSEWVDRLFDRLWSMYGTRFADMWAGLNIENVKAVWTDELADMTKAEVARGVESCRTREWPPTLPEFVKLCRPALDYQRAYVEAVNQMQRRKDGNDEWSNAAVYWAAVEIGNDLSVLSWDKLRSRWQVALDNAVEKIRKGEVPNEVPERLTALPAPGKTSVPTEVAKQRIDEMKRKLAESMMENKCS